VISGRLDLNQENEVSSMLLMKSGSEHRLKASVFQALTAITFY